MPLMGVTCALAGAVVIVRMVVRPLGFSERRSRETCVMSCEYRHISSSALATVGLDMQMRLEQMSRHLIHASGLRAKERPDCPTQRSPSNLNNFIKLMI